MPAISPNPFLINVTRADTVESRHSGAIAIVDHHGEVLAALGDVEQNIFPRSANKPLQTAPLIETGAATHFGLSSDEIALSCASHGGEEFHVATVARWLDRIGLDATALECGAHLPTSASAAEALLRRGENPSSLHNNCSGKHAGFLTIARHWGVDPHGYIEADHPVQRKITERLSEFYQLDLRHRPTGRDGCGIPTIAVPLPTLALGMAKLAMEGNVTGATILNALRQAPLMISGTGRFGSVLLAYASNRVAAKVGAEGVYTACLVDKGIGIALKIDDGAERAAEAAMATLLLKLGILPPGAISFITNFAAPTLYNRTEIAVGTIAAAPDLIDFANRLRTTHRFDY